MRVTGCTHFREDFFEAEISRCLPNANLYHRSGKRPISCLLRQDGPGLPDGNKKLAKLTSKNSQTQQKFAKLHEMVAILPKH